MSPRIRFLFEKLLLVWMLPRTSVDISIDHMAKLMSDLDHALVFFAALREKLKAEFKRSLGRGTRKHSKVCCLS
jgi:hypothetical protein